MKIIDTFSSFPDNPTIESLREYYEAYPEIFGPYFLHHCKDTDARLQQAIDKYADDWHSIKKVHQTIKDLLEDIHSIYQTKYKIKFPISINLIIGAYGSNAYAEREIIPDITLAMERLTSEENPLRVIIAHEFGHVAHLLISERYQMDWQAMQWEHPYIWLLQEGAATHFSKQMVPQLRESVYFSYDNYGEDWLAFAKEHHQDIIRCFSNDINSGKTTVEIYKEWFSIRGGSTYGITRLAYYIADCFFQDLIVQNGELASLLLWKDDGIFQTVEEWLKQ